MSAASLQIRAAITNASPVAFLFGWFLSARIALTLLAFQANPASGSAAEIGVLFLFVFLAWTFTSSQQQSLDGATPLRWICAYLAMTGVSLFWSVTDSVVVGLAYWAGLAAECFVIYLIMNSGDANENCERILFGFVGGAAFVGLIAWYLPTLSDLRIGDEDFLHPNALGYVLALATLCGMHLARKSRLAGLLAVFCGITLWRTISKACIAGFIASAAFYLLRASHLSRRAKIAIYAIAASSIVFGWSLVEAYVDMYDQGSHIETLTGRTTIWSIAWEEGIKTPWLGHGFYSFRFVVPMLGDFFPWQAHNELLQQLFCYGVVGLAVFAVLYVSFARFLYVHRGHEWFSLVVAIFVFVLVRGIADTERFDLNFPLWLLTLFTMVIARTQQERVTA
ncbi:O-antigen polymerase [Candidatus Koribacter versatilis Ellin345]|uniref:O-antigen polymerase n=1 Tax=Koribacter versatilis (strain Ellin345) TaxID=204669 RepID=Q1ITA6_KORVE|nr:O-antigen ligase family protein [Candidatus Koribacter versatilis]ABF39894.1 O-antigen polymerase [Candidatus Koribacter versatilis Ellin345]